MLSLHAELLGCVQFEVYLMLALVNAAVSSLADLLQEVVLVQEGVILEDVLVFGQAAAEGIHVFRRTFGLSPSVLASQGELVLDVLSFLCHERDHFQAHPQRF